MASPPRARNRRCRQADDNGWAPGWRVPPSPWLPQPRAEAKIGADDGGDALAPGLCSDAARADFRSEVVIQMHGDLGAAVARKFRRNQRCPGSILQGSADVEVASYNEDGIVGTPGLLLRRLPRFWECCTSEAIAQSCKEAAADSIRCQQICQIEAYAEILGAQAY